MQTTALIALLLLTANPQPSAMPKLPVPLPPSIGQAIDQQLERCMKLGLAQCDFELQVPDDLLEPGQTCDDASGEWVCDA